MILLLLFTVLPHLAMAKICYRCTDGVLAFDKRFLSPNRDTSACALMELKVPDSYKCIMESNFHKINNKFSIISGGAPKTSPTEADECKIKFDFKNSYMKCGCSGEKCNDSPPDTLAVKIAVGKYTPDHPLYPTATRSQIIIPTSTYSYSPVATSDYATSQGGVVTSTKQNNGNHNGQNDDNGSKTNNGKHTGQHDYSGGGLDPTCYHVFKEVIANDANLTDCYNYANNLQSHYQSWNSSLNVTKQQELTCNWCTAYKTDSSHNCTVPTNNRTNIGMFGGFQKAWCVRSLLTSDYRDPVASYYIMDEPDILSVVGNGTTLASGCYQREKQIGNFTLCICDQPYCNLEGNYH